MRQNNGVKMVPLFLARRLKKSQRHGGTAAAASGKSESGEILLCRTVRIFEVFYDKVMSRSANAMAIWSFCCSTFFHAMFCALQMRCTLPRNRQNPRDYGHPRLT